MFRTTRLKSFFLVVVCGTLAGAALGGVLGALIGGIAPGYYRAVFSNGGDPAFDPFSVGLGLGVTQGAVGGALVSGALLIWRERRKALPQEKAERVGRQTVWPLWLAVGLLLLIEVGRLLSGSLGSQAPRIVREGNEVNLWNFSLRDVLVTHLDAGDRQAALPKPILLKDHWDPQTVDLQTLEWTSPMGEKVDAPPMGQTIKMVYVATQTAIR